MLGGFWVPLRAGLAAEGHALHRRLLQMRNEVDIGDDVSALPVFDSNDSNAGAVKTRWIGPRSSHGTASLRDGG